MCTCTAILYVHTVATKLWSKAFHEASLCNQYSCSAHIEKQAVHPPRSRQTDTSCLQQLCCLYVEMNEINGLPRFISGIQNHSIPSVVYINQNACLYCEPLAHISLQFLTVNCNIYWMQIHEGQCDLLQCILEVG